MNVNCRGDEADKIPTILAILKSKEQLEVLRNQFDLAFTNMIDLCMPGLVHYLGIQRHIWVSTGPLPDAYHWLLGKLAYKIRL